jgi:hypothetical protein
VTKWTIWVYNYRGGSRGNLEIYDKTRDKKLEDIDSIRSFYRLNWISAQLDEIRTKGTFMISE